MECVGVDGARHGWLAVWENGRELDFALYDDPSALCVAHRAAAVIAVDVPIGLSDTGPREPDVLARRFVGGRRASSIFSAPVRAILDAATQAEASRRHRDIDGRGFGAQAFAILPKIRQWDSLLLGDPELRTRVFEVHPEVSFAALNNRIGLAERKKAPEGAEKRLELLGREFGFGSVRRLLDACPRSGAAPDDVLDALVALWSARRIATGAAQTLPSPARVDSAGMRMGIHY
jgi:predicted RNase H-like nuclease